MLARLIVAFGKCVRSKFRFDATLPVRIGKEQFPDQNEPIASFRQDYEEKPVSWPYLSTFDQTFHR
jgi:hypothetical protein